jgi:hypothetical protein
MLTGHFDQTSLYFYEPDGSLKLSQYEHNLTPLEQRHGFAGVQNQRFNTPQQFRAFRLSTDGAIQYELAQGGKALQAADPRGGIVLFSVARNELQAYDEILRLRWNSELTPVISNPASVSALGVDLDGNTLVLFDGTRDFGAGTLGGVWVDAFGSAGRNFQAASGVSTWDELNLVASVTEGLFLQHVRYTYQAPLVTWLASYLPLSPSQLAPPTWLAERPGTSMTPIHGGTGYGLFSHPSPAGSGCTVEVLTADGESCGAIDFDHGGRGCRSMAIGHDGTVITQPSRRWTEDCNATTDGACSWTWQWWPGFFE